MKTLNPLAPLAVIAQTQIGRHEDGNTNTGSQIAAYQAATSLGAPSPGNGWPWCCAFVEWCILQFIRTYPGVLSCESKRPTTASVTGFLEWATETGQDIYHSRQSAQPGDIVVMKFPTGYHIGIVAGDPVDGVVLTVEGNTSGPEDGDQRNGGEVASKHRGAPEIQAFIRLSVKAQAV